MSQLQQATCPECKSQYPLYDPRNTAYFGCPNCLSLTDLTENRVMKEMEVPEGRIKLPIGTKGILLGNAYTVIAVSVREEVGTEYYWREYTLLREKDNAKCFLSEYNYHWNLMEPVQYEGRFQGIMHADVGNLHFEGKRYDRHSSYDARYAYASGEYDWNIMSPRAVACVEFIHPPYTIAFEKNTNDSMHPFAFHGTYLKRGIIQEAFDLKDSLPSRIGIAPAQPTPLGVTPKTFAWGTLLFTLLVILLQIMFNQTEANRLVYQDVIYVDTANVPHVTPSFELTGRPGAMELQMSSNVDNNWAEASVSLVNESTGKEEMFALGNEFYSGIDEGERWTEGKLQTTEQMCHIVPGKYHFVIIASTGSAVAPVRVELAMFWGVPSYWNAIFISIVMLVMAIAFYGLDYYYDKHRWEYSNFSGKRILPDSDIIITPTQTSI